MMKCPRCKREAEPPYCWFCAAKIVPAPETESEDKVKPKTEVKEKK